MTTIKATPPFFFIETPSREGRSRVKEQEQSSNEALEFRREDSGVHRLYEGVSEADRADRSERIRELKDQIKKGTYEPNLSIVAERMLFDLGLHLN